jgi:hypothetical protein
LLCRLYYSKTKWTSQGSKIHKLLEGQSQVTLIESWSHHHRQSILGIGSTAALIAGASCLLFRSFSRRSRPVVKTFVRLGSPGVFVIGSPSLSGRSSLSAHLSCRYALLSTINRASRSVCVTSPQKNGKGTLRLSRLRSGCEICTVAEGGLLTGLTLHQ